MRAAQSRTTVQTAKYRPDLLRGVLQVLQEFRGRCLLRRSPRQAGSVPPPPATEHHRLVGVDPSWFSGLKPKTQALADSVSAETPLPSFTASS